MKPGFIITSALNTRFGVYDAATRLEQTIDTIASIEDRCPNANITLIEMAGEELKDDQRAILQPLVTNIFDFTHEKAVKDIYTGTDNWDVVKSLTELTCFGHALNMIAHSDEYRGVDRFFKVSGRYVLNENFRLSDYTKPEYNNKIVFAKKRASQFDPKITGGVTSQYMSRCWSFPASELTNMHKQFTAMRLCMIDIIQKGGYLDIEHLLYLYTNAINILEVDTIGVQGLLGPNGYAVKD